MSKPNQSAIVVLVPQAEAFVRSVRQRYGLAPARVPAHITVLFPFKAPDELTPAVVADLGRLFARYGPFSFSLSELGTFPDTLYLVPTPGKPFVELTRAVHEQFPETPPYEGAFDEIVPHLTLARAPEEMPFERMVQEVEVDLGPQLPLEIRATEIDLLDNACGEWCVNSTFALGG
jgi:2'-5' RNA ligase